MFFQIDVKAAKTFSLIQQAKFETKFTKVKFVS